jgi:hypothetical protein
MTDDFIKVVKQHNWPSAGMPELNSWYLKNKPNKQTNKQTKTQRFKNLLKH